MAGKREKESYNTNEALKIATINLSEKQIEFFDKMKEMGMTASRSEALRLCVNISMSYFMKMIDFLENPFIGSLEEKVKAIMEKMALDESQAKRTVKKLENKKTVYPRNIFWEKRLINGKLLNIPIEPGSNEELIFLENYGYVPVSRLGDLETNEDKDLKEIVKEVLNNKGKKPKQEDSKKNPYNNIIANSAMNKYRFQGGS